MANIINTVRTLTIADAYASYNPHATKNGKARLTVGCKEGDSFYRVAIFGDEANRIKTVMEEVGAIQGSELVLQNPSEATSSDGQTKFLNTALRVAFKAAVDAGAKAEIEKA